MTKLKKKISIVLLIAVCCIIFGATAVYFWPTMFEKILLKELVLAPNSTSFQMWNKTPIPMYLKVYFFNWTNHDESFRNSSIKPNFVEMGPYVFREVDYKVNQVWNKNGTVTFQQRRIWNFESSLSKGSLMDKVTNLNPVAATIAYTIRNYNQIIKSLASIALKKLEKIAITKSVKEILFDGYDDELLRWAVEFNMTSIPYNKFAWFYKRNSSDSYDGTFNMLTGSNNLYERGLITNWKFNNISPYYSKTCGKFKGTNGDLWPPLLNNESVSVFSPDVCTTLTLKAAGTADWLGLTGHKFISDKDTFDNGTRVQSRKCYCHGVDCQPSGTLNVSNCKFGAPAFISSPHFYLADDSYRQSISGMKPNKESHEFLLLIHPTTGVPMKVRATLQLNFLIQPDKSITYFEHLPKMYVPMLWFTQEANLTNKYAKQIKLLTILPPLGSGILFSFVGIGILLVAISLIVYFRQRLKDEQNQNLLSKDDHKNISCGEVNIISEE